MRGAAILACTILLSGCYSFSTLGRARVVDEGQVEVFVAPEALVVASASGGSARPIGEGGVRYGLTDAVELDARITTLGVTAGPRIQLYRSEDPSSGVDVLIAPALAYTSTDKLALELPVLVGFNLGEHQLVLAPRVAYQMRFGAAGQDGPVSFVYLGGSVGFAIRVDPHVILLPEVALLGEIYADPGYASNLARALGLQLAFGLLFDT